MALSAAIAVVLRIGWREPLVMERALLGVEYASLFIYALSLVLPNRVARRPISALLKDHTFESTLCLLAATLLWWPIALTVIVQALAVYQLLRLYMQMIVRTPSPSWVFLLTFGGLIASGTLALKLPISTPREHPISVVDALFTSTSAVCVTGLVVRDTGTEFTRAGQWIILGLIQLGGLGIVVFGALAILMLGSAMGLRASSTFAETTAEGHARPTTVRKLVVFIALATVLMELIGAATLFVGLPGEWNGAPSMATRADRAFHSVFLAISAFCNAGFSTASNSLEGLRMHWTSHIVIVGLIVMGGLGFPAIDNLRSVVVAKLSGRRIENGVLVRLSLHTKLVLATTAALYLAGAGIIAIGRLIQGDEGIGMSLLDGHFMSVTARTAGFDTVAPGTMGPLSRLALITFMFVGGSPGSMAGGVKTIVFAIIVLTIWATMRGKLTTQAFGRAIPEDLVRKAATLITLGAGTIALLTLALSATDGRDGRALGDLLFEVVSASSTVGLTTGVTPTLSIPGRLIIIAAMFLGRVGPLVMLVALVSVGARRRPAVRYADESVVMS